MVKLSTRPEKRIGSDELWDKTEKALADALTANGARSLGWDAGRISPGALADLVTVRLDSTRTAGARSGDVLAHALFAATGADVTDVIVGGRPVVRDGVHQRVSDVGEALNRAIAAVLAPAT